MRQPRHHLRSPIRVPRVDFCVSRVDFCVSARQRAYDQARQKQPHRSEYRLGAPRYRQPWCEPRSRRLLSRALATPHGGPLHHNHHLRSPIRSEVCDLRVSTGACPKSSRTGAGSDSPALLRPSSCPRRPSSWAGVAFLASAPRTGTRAFFSVSWVYCTAPIGAATSVLSYGTKGEASELDARRGFEPLR